MNKNKNYIRVHIRFVRCPGHATRTFHTMGITVFPSSILAIICILFFSFQWNNHTSHIIMNKHYGGYYITYRNIYTYYIITACRRLF